MTAAVYPTTPHVQPSGDFFSAARRAASAAPSPAAAEAYPERHHQPGRADKLGHGSSPADGLGPGRCLPVAKQDETGPGGRWVASRNARALGGAERSGQRIPLLERRIEVFKKFRRLGVTNPL